MTSFKIQGEKFNFKHGLFQVFLMFLGEWLNLLIFGGRMTNHGIRKENLQGLKDECELNNQEMQFTKLWMAIPCLLDTIGSTLSLVSLLLIPASL